MSKPKYKNYRTCCNLKKEKVFELYKYCQCPECRYRQRLTRTPANRITVTTKDILKVDEIAEFLSNWSCGDGKRQLETCYLKF